MFASSLVTSFFSQTILMKAIKCQKSDLTFWLNFISTLCLFKIVSKIFRFNYIILLTSSSFSFSSFFSFLLLSSPTAAAVVVKFFSLCRIDLESHQSGSQILIQRSSPSSFLAMANHQHDHFILLAWSSRLYLSQSEFKIMMKF